MGSQDPTALEGATRASGHPAPGIDQPVPAAIVEVTKHDHDLAEVHLLYQTEARSLVGARARRIPKDDRARLGKYVARITQVNLSRVRIDVGVLDKGVVGDVYAILSPRDHTPIGRGEITEVGDRYAWGKRLDQREEFRDQLARARSALPAAFLGCSSRPRRDPLPPRA